jgi:hypothetical protein
MGLTGWSSPRAALLSNGRFNWLNNIEILCAPRSRKPLGQLGTTNALTQGNPSQHREIQENPNHA